VYSSDVYGKQLCEKGLIFLWDFRSCCVQDCTKFPSLITNVLLRLVTDSINGLCYQRYVKRLEQQKGLPYLNVCATEENSK